MEQNKIHIDQLLEASYLGFEPEVPDFAWDRIEAALDNKKKRFIWYTWHKVAIIAVVSILGFLGTRSFLNQTDSRVASEPSSVNQSAKNNSNQSSQDNSAAPTGENKDQMLTAEQMAPAAKKVSVNAGSNSQEYVAPVVKEDIVETTHSTVSNPATEDNTAESVKQFELLSSLGFEGTNATVSPETQLASKNKLSFQVLPLSPYRHKWYVGFGLGQLVSSTGYTVNPEFNNYVHKNFTKRMSEGEGLLASLNFSGSLGYRISGVHFLYTGVNYYQRRNSLNFNFTDEAPALNAVNNPPLDRFGRYPIKDYLSSGIEVNFKGTNIVTAVELPLGWMAQIPVGKHYTFIPAASANIGFLSQGASNMTLDYQFLEVANVQKSWTRSNYLLMNTSAGIYRDLGMRIQWGIGATANYTATQMYVSGASVRPRAFTGGLTTQLIWRLD